MVVQKRTLQVRFFTKILGLLVLIVSLCFSNLNGQYLLGKVDHTKFHGKGMTWNPFRGDDYSLKRSRMMIKRVLNQ